MYLNLGQDVVLKEDVIGVFDLDTATVAAGTREFLRKAERGGRAVTLGSELPKSFIVAQKKDALEQTVYISLLSASTLAKRAEDVF